jgi:hypothetical protein
MSKPVEENKGVLSKQSQMKKGTTDTSDAISGHEGMPWGSYGAFICLSDGRWQIQKADQYMKSLGLCFAIEVVNRGIGVISEL